MLILNLTLYIEQTETSKTFINLPQNFVTRGITNFHSRSSIFMTSIRPCISLTA